MVRFVGFSILQVCHGELDAGRHVIAHSRQPQWFEVQQVTGVFLGRPLFLRFLDQGFVRTGRCPELRTLPKNCRTAEIAWYCRVGVAMNKTQKQSLVASGECLAKAAVVIAKNTFLSA
jgi:hypothetical protein